MGTGSYPYLDFFKLRQAPFTPMVDDAFFFSDPAISQRLDMLRHLVHYSDLLLVVIGVQGSGKSSLLQRFLGSVAEQMVVCRVDAEFGMDAQRLLQRIGSGFGLSSPPSGTAALAEALGSLPAGRPALLLIDDAHRLSIGAVAELLELAELEGARGKLLRIVLFCEPAIDELLAAPSIAPLRDRITQTMEIPPFTEEQTDAYLHYRMRVAGLTSEFPFSPKLVKMIHKGARGNPARINELAHRALMEMSDEEPSQHPLAWLQGREKWLPLAAGVAVLLLAVLLLPGREEQEPRLAGEVEEHALPIAPEGEQGEAETVVLVPKKEGEGGGISTAPQRPEIELAVAEEVSSHKPPPGAEQAGPRLKGWPAGVGEEQHPGASAPPVPLVEIPAAAQREPVVAPAPIIEVVEPEPVTASWKRQPITLRGSGFDAGSRVTVGWTGRVKELDPEQVVVKGTHEIQMFITTGMEADTWTVRVTNAAGRNSKIATFYVKPAAASASAGGTDRVVAAPKGGAEGIRREAWLTAQNPNHYTVQLMGSGREKDVIDFVKRHGLKGELAYFRGLSQGKAWYSLVFGVYPDFKSASRAASRLGRKLKGSSPWVRRIGNIRILLADLAAPPAVPASLLPESEQDVDWLRRQDPRHFTLQLLAGRDRGTIEEFLRTHGPADGAVYFRTMRGGKEWYALVYNSYGSKADALAALKRLPRAWRKYRPWMRSFASIQKELLQSE